MEIPGYYFDETKKKYFKITHNDGGFSASKYSSSSIKKENEKNERSRKRAKFETKPTNKVPFTSKEAQHIQSMISSRPIDQIRARIQEFEITKLRFEGSMKTRGRLNSDSLKKITCDGQSMILSSLNNIYEIPLESLEFNSTQELFPMLKLHRVDKVTSLLRDLTIVENNETRPIIRTWFGGSPDEPSEVELSTEVPHMTTRSHVQSPKNESFNKSIYNYHSDSILICGSKSVLKYSSNLFGSNRQVIYKGSDVLSIDSKEKNIYVLGTRNGQAIVVDDRLDYRRFSQGTDNRRGNSPLINIKCLSADRVLCSYLGSKLKLFDIRMGFKNPLVDYNTAKSVQNAFGEQLEMIDDRIARLQNQSLCEFFNITNPVPLKTIEFGSDEQAIDSCSSLKGSAQRLLTTDGKNIGFYG